MRLASIRMSPTLDGRKFSLVAIEKYFVALHSIWEMDLDGILDRKVFGRAVDVTDLIRMLPPLYFHANAKSASELELKRVIRFFFNCGRLPFSSEYSNLFGSILLVKQLIDNGDTDIASAFELSSHELYSKVLPQEEAAKLGLYGQLSGAARIEVECAFWKAEDIGVCQGRIKFLIYCTGLTLDTLSSDNFNLSLFRQIAFSFELLFLQHDDLLRRAILTKGDYTWENGNTPTLGGKRYSFCNGLEDWQWFVRSRRFDAHLKELVLEFDRRLRGYGNDRIVSSNSSEGVPDASAPPLSLLDVGFQKLHRKAALKGVIADYLEVNLDDSSWRMFCIRNPKILDYCQQKLFCYLDDDPKQVYALQNKRATEGSYRSFSEFV
jgi:hypothetical protein